MEELLEPLKLFDNEQGQGCCKKSNQEPLLFMAPITNYSTMDRFSPSGQAGLSSRSRRIQRVDSLVKMHQRLQLAQPPYSNQTRTMGDYREKMERVENMLAAQFVKTNLLSIQVSKQARTKFKQRSLTSENLTRFGQCCAESSQLRLPILMPQVVCPKLKLPKGPDCAKNTMTVTARVVGNVLKCYIAFWPIEYHHYMSGDV
ncbi:hypothetical protein KIN20_003738 [Parelaphostrongylus tenuis]|uniref:Uncharacterized protein n=1 Tax=Parelaphostrongylus tenuis TaxID=148309 RepID=A0AAD5M208_PARTN|nr:hypothetical protein KIN20_003738 [Parelaphostrongylus tenuis]